MAEPSSPEHTHNQHTLTKRELFRVGAGAAATAALIISGNSWLHPTAPPEETIHLKPPRVARPIEAALPIVTDPIDVYPSSEYAATMQQLITNARSRAYIQTMIFDTDGVARDILNNLKERAAHIDAQFLVDGYSLASTNGVPSYLQFGETRQKSQEEQKLLDELTASGVKVGITNPPGFVTYLIPSVGRNHMKMLVADDRVFTGGINLIKDNLSHDDWMIELKDPALRDAAVRVFEASKANQLQRDMRIQSTSGVNLLVDAGVRNKSIILDEAIKTVDNAKHSILLTTQFLPEGRMLDALTRAQERGVVLRIIASNPDAIHSPMGNAYNWAINTFSGGKLDKLPIEKIDRWVHMKALAVDLEQGGSIMTGSNNFAETGVKFGTAELALQVTNPTALKKMEKALLEMYPTP